MEYRKMENLGISTSLLGFGCMRFPTNADGSINEEEALAMIDRAYQAGVLLYISIQGFQIEINLSNMLRLKFSNLQLNRYKTGQSAVIEQQVDVILKSE